MENPENTSPSTDLSRSNKRKRTTIDKFRLHFIGNSAGILRQIIDLITTNERFADYFTFQRNDLDFVAWEMANAEFADLPGIPTLIRPTHGLVLEIGAYVLETNSADEKELAKNMMTTLCSVMAQHETTYCIIIAVLPRHKKPMENYPELQRFNERASKFNAHLREYIRGSPNFRFMDFRKSTPTEEVEKFIADDGVNLNFGGLELFIFYLRQITLEELLPAVKKNIEESNMTVTWNSSY